MDRKRAAAGDAPREAGAKRARSGYVTNVAAYAAAVDAAEALDARLVAEVEAREAGRAAKGAASLAKLRSRQMLLGNRREPEIERRPWMKLMPKPEKQQQQQVMMEALEQGDAFRAMRKKVGTWEYHWKKWNALDEEGREKYLEKYGAPPKEVPDDIGEFAEPEYLEKMAMKGEIPENVAKMIQIKQQQKGSIPRPPPTTDAQKLVAEMDPREAWRMRQRAVTREYTRRYRLKKMTEEQKAQYLRRIQRRALVDKLLGIDEDEKRPVLLSVHKDVAPENETPEERKLRKAAEHTVMIQLSKFQKLSDEGKEQYLETQRTRELQRIVEQAQKDDLRIRNPNVELKPHVQLAMQILDRRAEAALEAHKRYRREYRRQKSKEMRRRRRTTKRQRLRLRRLRKDPLALVRERMPVVWKRPQYADKLWLKWNSEKDRDLLTLMQERVESEYTECMWCATCTWARKGGHKFLCRRRSCFKMFNDPLDMMEHQVRDHGRIFLNCRACLDKLGRRSVRVNLLSLIPPVTVYMWSQLFRPAQRPEQWTSLNQVEVEHAMFKDNVESVQPLMRRYLEKSLNIAIERAARGGLSELKTQYEVAMQHYKSALVSPAGDTRSCCDGSIQVGPGRNWLVRQSTLHRLQFVCVN